MRSTVSSGSSTERTWTTRYEWMESRSCSSKLKPSASVSATSSSSLKRSTMQITRASCGAYLQMRSDTTSISPTSLYQWSASSYLTSTSPKPPTPATTTLSSKPSRSSDV